jgi:phytoene dehydrogenase-like protein
VARSPRDASAGDAVTSELDAVVIGSGPNGLAAAIALAQQGHAVRVLEAAETIGGGMRTAELTLPGFRHDICSAVHPLGILSPFFATLPLAEHGLKWLSGPLSFAHPLDDGPFVVLERSVEATAEGLGRDGRAYRKLMEGFVRVGAPLMSDLLGPFRLPRHPFAMARFGFYGLRSALGLFRGLFDDDRARALFAGCAAHAIQPLDKMLTGAVGMMFAWTGHLCDWPVAQGGSSAIADALAGYLRALGGQIVTSHHVARMEDLPKARAYLFDCAPRQVIDIAGDALPAGYVKRLSRYRYGPGVFKVDWALSGPIPWRDPNALRASTVHIGGKLEDVARAEGAMYRGEHPDRPFVLVGQQSLFDPTRAPAGKQTGYAYCHVPYGSTLDVTDRIEAQVERFAPGFRDLILARHTHSPAELERHNPSMIGGVIGGGEADLTQFFTRPVTRLDPYSTPNPRLWFCSGSTPPGAGVHGMCGYFAAKSVARRLARGSI